MSADQTMLQRSARDFLRRECPPSRVNELAEDPIGYDRDLWRAMAELGWQGWVFPTALGGGGGRFLDLVLLEEELGRALVPSPFFASVIRAGLTILWAGTEADQTRLLPGVASGDAILTLANAEPGGRVEGDLVACRALRIGHRWQLDGTKVFVPYAGVAHGILCVARTAGAPGDRDGITLMLVDPATPGVTRRQTQTLGRDQQYEVGLVGAWVEDSLVVGEVDGARAGLERAQASATVCLAAEMLGGAEVVLDMTLEYAAARRQRGRAIGRHQALQHRCADVAIAIDAARVLIYDAAWRLDQGLPATTEVSMAKASISETYRNATWLAAMIHGGTGFMEDHALALHYRRAKVAELLMGDGDIHREIVARALLDTPGVH